MTKSAHAHNGNRFKNTACAPLEQRLDLCAELIVSYANSIEYIFYFLWYIIIRVHPKMCVCVYYLLEGIFCSEILPFPFLHSAMEHHYFKSSLKFICNSFKWMQKNENNFIVCGYVTEMEEKTCVLSKIQVKPASVSSNQLNG